MDPQKFQLTFRANIKKRSDTLIEIFLALYFLVGLLLATYYDTWLIAIVVGGLCLAAYFITKKLLPNSTVHHYVSSAALGVFMAQFIYQMHGMFEMHFFAFVGSALMITYQNWKAQIPVAVVVVVHHAVFGLLQYQQFESNLPNTIFFTQLNYMSLETFIIHGILASVIFFICGLWAFEMDKRSNETIENTKNILTVAHANDNVARNLEYAILLSEGELNETIRFNDGDLMGEALSKIQKKLA
ncbi:MAG TPA: hypothetical protein VFG46_12895 [Chryseolinea sp.]|nr:hypothetical protein [Chryseolinea sp.]